MYGIKVSLLEGKTKHDLAAVCLGHILGNFSWV